MLRIGPKLINRATLLVKKHREQSITFHQATMTLMCAYDNNGTGPFAVVIVSTRQVDEVVSALRNCDKSLSSPQRRSTSLSHILQELAQLAPAHGYCMLEI